jgi:hypothetical protein
VTAAPGKWQLAASVPLHVFVHEPVPPVHAVWRVAPCGVPVTVTHVPFGDASHA